MLKLRLVLGKPPRGRIACSLLCAPVAEPSARQADKASSTQTQALRATSRPPLHMQRVFSRAAIPSEGWPHFRLPRGLLLICQKQLAQNLIYHKQIRAKNGGPSDDRVYEISQQSATWI
jgi:hypothetical protein